MTRFIAYRKRDGEAVARGGTLQQARDRVTLTAPIGIEIVDFGDDAAGLAAWDAGERLHRAMRHPFVTVAFDGARLGLPEPVWRKPLPAPPVPLTPGVPYVRGPLPVPPPRQRQHVAPGG